MAGMLIARAIAENDPSWRAFAPYELVWAGGLAGRTVVQLGYAGFRLRNRARFVVARMRHGAASLPPLQHPHPDAARPGADAMVHQAKEPQNASRVEHQRGGARSGKPEFQGGG
jgi:hypothetical protein